MIVVLFNAATQEAYGRYPLYNKLEEFIKPYSLISINSLVLDEEGNFPCSFAFRNGVDVDKVLSGIAEDFNEMLTNPPVQSSVITDVASHPSFKGTPQQWMPERVLDVKLKVL